MNPSPISRRSSSRVYALRVEGQGGDGVKLKNQAHQYWLCIKGHYVILNNIK